MVVHQNITNLAGYFHFLNVRKIPYVIFPPQFALRIPTKARACEQFLLGLSVAGGNDAGPPVLGRDLLVGYALQRWEFFKAG